MVCFALPAVILFENAGRQDGKALPADANPADYYGYYHPGGDKPLMSLRVWAPVDRDGKAQLSGTVRVYDPNGRDKPLGPDMTDDVRTASAAQRRRDRERAR